MDYDADSAVRAARLPTRHLSFPPFYPPFCLSSLLPVLLLDLVLTEVQPYRETVICWVISHFPFHEATQRGLLTSLGLLGRQQLAQRADGDSGLRVCYLVRQLDGSVSMSTFTHFMNLAAVSGKG